MKKSGITMVSIVIYVVIFFALVAIATGTTMAMNSNSLKDKGKIYVNEAEIVLKTNFLNSLNNSKNINIIDNDRIVFSNNDVYRYDEDKDILYKNDGIFVQNITEFNFSKIESQQGITSINVTGTILKYGNEKQFNLFVYKGDNI